MYSCRTDLGQKLCNREGMISVDYCGSVQGVCEEDLLQEFVATVVKCLSVVLKRANPVKFWSG